MIRIVNLQKSFGDNQVLGGVNLEIVKGETMVVIGQSGSGKSVLLKHIIGLLKPDLGEIWIGGIEVTKLDEDELQQFTGKFGMLFQGAALFDSMTVAENVAFGLERHTDFPPEEICAIVRESLSRVGLHGVEDMMPFELSGGMKKRVGLARAIAYQPEIMLYDEPSTGLDPIRADAINDLINMLKRDMGVTSVVITHDMASSFKIADRIAMLYEGVIIEVGTPDEIRNSRSPIVQQFIHGESQGPIKTW
ncbi:MAG: ABC transporter ATP-binding protein [Candidatus Aminicenantes bacterium RBG_16_63_16]|nr:MAG: ABC transporter ATP-binding protein [Candidatus Aminicenantes bacterium RBG_16_63_16]